MKNKFITILLSTCLTFSLALTIGICLNSESKTQQVLAAKSREAHIETAMQRAEFMYNYRWTCKKDLYSVWSNTFTYKAGSSYTIPYSQGYNGHYLFYNVTLAQFEALAADPNSVMYTKTYDRAGNGYGMDCSSFAAFVIGYKSRLTTTTIDTWANSKSNGFYYKDYDTIAVGDMVNTRGSHVMIVKAVNGNNVTVYEQTPQYSRGYQDTKITDFTKATLQSKGYKVIGFDYVNHSTSAPCDDVTAKLNSATPENPSMETKGCGFTLSANDGDVNFNTMAQTSASFAFVTLGNATTGSIDSKFTTNINGLISIGKHRGVWVNSSATTTTQAQQEANWVFDTLLNMGYLRGQIDFPIVYNWDYSVKDQTSSTAIINAFANELIDKNLYPAMFTSGGNFNNYINKDALNCDVYLAWYKTSDSYIVDFTTNKYYHEKVKILQYDNGTYGTFKDVPFFTAQQAGSQASAISQNCTLKDYASEITLSNKNRTNVNSQISNDLTNWDISQNYSVTESNYANRKITLDNNFSHDNVIAFLNTDSTKIKTTATFKVLGKASTELWAKFGLFITNQVNGAFFYVDASGTEGTEPSTISGTNFGIVKSAEAEWQWKTEQNITYNGNFNPLNTTTLQIIRDGKNLFLFVDNQLIGNVDLTNYGLSDSEICQVEIRSFNTELEVTNYSSGVLTDNSEIPNINDNSSNSSSSSSALPPSSSANSTSNSSYVTPNTSSSSTPTSNSVTTSSPSSQTSTSIENVTSSSLNSVTSSSCNTTNSSTQTSSQNTTNSSAEISSSETSSSSLTQSSNIGNQSDKAENSGGGCSSNLSTNLPITFISFAMFLVIFALSKRKSN